MEIQSILAFLPVYVTAFVSLYSLIAWGFIFESRKKLSEGFLKTLTTKIMVGVGLIFLLAIWMVFVNVSALHDFKVQLMNYLFLVIMITFVTWLSLSVHKLAKQYGFTVTIDNLEASIEKDKKAIPQKKGFPKNISKK